MYVYLPMFLRLEYCAGKLTMFSSLLNTRLPSDAMCGDVLSAAMNQLTGWLSGYVRVQT